MGNFRLSCGKTFFLVQIYSKPNIMGYLKNPQKGKKKYFLKWEFPKLNKLLQASLLAPFGIAKHCCSLEISAYL